MKKLTLKYLIPGLILFFLGSCTKNFEEYNTNPNSPGLDQASPDMLLTQAIESMTDRVHEIFLGHEMGSCWVQHMAKVQYTDEDRYIPRISVINNSWTSFYAASGYDVATIIKIAESTGQDNYKGVGLVLKVYISSVLTDLFGDIPYTDAWKGAVDDGSIIQPVYDTQESIYLDMIAKMDEANTLLTDAAEIPGDILYGGDPVLWQKFANSLRLRLLLRMSARDEALAIAEMTKMVDDPDTYPIFESSADHAALQYLGSAPNNHPINENRKTRDDHRVSKSLIDLTYVNNALVDWRVSLYAELDGNDDYEGLPNGLTSSKAAAYNDNGLKFTSKIGSFYAQATAPGMLMSYAELQFILAEAAQKGYIAGGDVAAENYYLEGIWASYNQNHDYFAGVLDDVWGGTFEAQLGWDGVQDIVEFAFENYVANGAHTYDKSTYYPVAYDPAIAREQIAYERWVAGFDQGLQSWFEWRRTGIPELTPAEDGVNGGKVPIRVTYPSDEYSRNKTNLDAAISNQGADDLNTPVWWDVEVTK
jgi:hypothetical protein